MCQSVFMYFSLFKISDNGFKQLNPQTINHLSIIQAIKWENGFFFFQLKWFQFGQKKTYIYIVLYIIVVLYHLKQEIHLLNLYIRYSVLT